MSNACLFLLLISLSGAARAYEIKAEPSSLATRGMVKELNSMTEIGNFIEVGTWNNLSSSQLKTSGKNSYGPENLSDGNTATAWVEGVKGDGIGQSFTYQFETLWYENAWSTNTLATQSVGQLFILNGYAKSKASWRQNGRVKKFNVLLNGKPLFGMGLLDSDEVQQCNLAKDQVITVHPGDRLTFEIAEIYKGEKWDDTALSELIISSW